MLNPECHLVRLESSSPPLGEASCCGHAEGAVNSPVIRVVSTYLRAPSWAKPPMRTFPELLDSPSAPKSMPLNSGMAFSALRIFPLPPPTNRASAALALALYSAGISATRRSAALRKGLRRRTLQRSFGPVGIPVVRLKLSTDWTRLISCIWSPGVWRTEPPMWFEGDRSGTIACGGSRTPVGPHSCGND